MRHLYHCALGIVEPRGAWFPPSNWYVRLISVNHGASGVSEPTALNPPESDALDLIHCMIMNANDCQLSLLDFDFTPRTPPGRLPIAMSFVWYSGIVFVAVLTAALVRRASCRAPPSPLVTGKKNTVLFLTDCAHGLSKVHVATTLALLQKYPSVDIHYASFPMLKGELQRVSDAANSKSAEARPIQWHELRGPSFIQAAMRTWGDATGLIAPPGIAGSEKLLRDFELVASPWTADELWDLYCQMQ